MSDAAETARQLRGKPGRVTVEGPIRVGEATGWLYVGGSLRHAVIPLGDPDINVTVEALPEPPPPEWKPGMHLLLADTYDGRGKRDVLVVWDDPPRRCLAKIVTATTTWTAHVSELDQWWREGRLTFAPCTTDGAQ